MHFRRFYNKNPILMPGMLTVATGTGVASDVFAPQTTSTGFKLQLADYCHVVRVIDMEGRTAEWPPQISSSNRHTTMSFMYQ